MRDPYAVLGVPRSATTEDIKKCYRRLAKALHPDTDENDPKAAVLFAELNAAYQILSDEDKRQALDRGEIDARGEPAPRGFPARRTIEAALMIVLSLLAAAFVVILREPDKIYVNNSVKETVSPRAGANDGHAGAARTQQPDRKVKSAPHLLFQPSASFADTAAVPLGIQVSGQAPGVALEISGLPPEMTISSGRTLGAGRWRILATDVAEAMIYPPPGFDGAVDLQVELKLADDAVIDRGWLHREWRQRPSVAAASIESVGSALGKSADHETANPTTADDNVHAAAQLDQAQIDFLIGQSQTLIAAGDIEAARILLRRAADAHDARAALALGATYDPIMLAKLNVQGVAGDTSLARDWYKKAAEFGSQVALERLNLLGR
ncbi:MAG TPA: J domain-containing protein [Xanthobacteraceae bacterium]|jgi:TPR repeat protein